MPDALQSLLDLRRLPERSMIGLMSGTSADGVDAVLCRIAGAGEDTRVTTESFVTVPFAPALRARVLGLHDAPASELADVDVLLGECFAQAAHEVCRAAGKHMGDVHLIGSHGQTALHHPRSAGHIGATLQIGQAAVIAERTGRPVLCDFRVRDVAAGGEGAPLVPLVDHLLFRSPDGRRRALQNIGGIANVTLVGRRIEDVAAFDNGPGNMALDAVVRRATGGAEQFDRDGERAARGRIDTALLDELHQHPYLAQRLPKSAGRELFGNAFVAPLLDRWSGRLDDLVATLTRFTAESVARSYRELLPEQPAEIYVSGGGALNPVLLAHLRELLRPMPVETLWALGMDPKAKEAIAFAVLANETLHGNPGNVPQVTGAAGPRVLGKIIL